MKIIHFFTSNLSKFKELSSIIATNTAFQLIHYNITLPELQGNFDEIVINKCMTAASIIDGPVLVDDAGLVCEAFNGLPGPYTKDVIGKLGLQRFVELLSNYTNKAAKAICTLGYTEGPNKEIKLFTGTVEGNIIPTIQTTYGSCFNAIFQPNGSKLTIAELLLEQENLEQRHNYSHRYKAFMLLKDFLILRNNS